MKSGKIILGSAAFLVTIGSSLAFKAANSFRTKKVLVQIGTPGGIDAQCLQCKALWTTNLVKHSTKCQTISGSSVQGRGTNHFTFFTAVKSGSVVTCTHPTTKTTSTQ